MFFGAHVSAAGGISNAIVGSFVLVLLATAFSLPLGVLIAIYVNELAPRLDIR